MCFYSYKKGHREKKNLVTIITLTGFGEYCYICKKGSTETFVAPEKAAFICDAIGCHKLPDVIPWISCIVGNVAIRFRKMAH